MFIVKFIVLFVTFSSISCFIGNYCELCIDHVMCKYNKSGEGEFCKGYDKSAVLTEDDIQMITNKINDRRNFVALGYARNPTMPQAANMRKITWSEELATFAQRWADQCDPAVHPEKTDQCRNLEDMQVGQNVASISGLSPGLVVKSFIDVWFLQSLDYTGSVSYFNRSQDHSTDYFTQLIWGETQLVGCGKAKFYIGNGKVVIERLVCNFAPKGNIDRKPIYLLGFPATQCSEGTIQDDTFPGLCTNALLKPTDETTTDKTRNRKTIVAKSEIYATTKPSTFSSMLRILNLFNNSITQEIDPIRYDLKQGILKLNDTNSKGHQKLRHILNVTNVAVNPVLPQLNYPLSFKKNISRRQEHDHHNQHDRGHSHLHHDYSFTSLYTQEPHIADEFKRYENVLSDDYRRHQHQQQQPPFLDDDFRRHQNVVQHCTRKEIEAPPIMLPPPMPAPLPPPLLPPLPPFPPTYLQNTDCFVNKCTRGEKNCCNPMPMIPSTFEQPLVTKPDCDHQQGQCACFSHPSTCQTVRCCEGSCQCIDHKSHCGLPVEQGCQHILRRHNVNSEQLQNKKTTNFQYDDNIPSVALRNGVARRGGYPLSITDYVTANTKSSSAFTPDSILRINLHQNQNNKRVKNIHLKSQKPQDHNYSYDVTRAKRKKRKDFNNDISTKQFWKMERHYFQNPIQLKSLRYTTLSNPRYRNYRRTKSRTITEPITILSDVEQSQQNDHQHHVKEKFLSFDELMNLRKNRIGDFENSGRRRHNPALRQNKATTAKPAVTKAPATVATTTSATTNSTKASTLPRIKQCTRQMTCTWTTINFPGGKGGPGGANGGGGGGGGGGGPGGNGIPYPGGSRTPPGYVDGCSRTSTCTREYMDRNKMTLAESAEGSGEGDEEGDEDGDGDYCEKRALNVEKRDFDETRDHSVRKQNYDDMFTEKPLLISTNYYIDDDDIKHNIEITSFSNDDTKINDTMSELTQNGDCLCDTKHSKAKRFANGSSCTSGEVISENKNKEKNFSYQNIYRSIIKNILNSKRNKFEFYPKRCLCGRLNSNISCTKL